MIFANWRGFSGGQQDMYDKVLKQGSKIVESANPNLSSHSASGPLVFRCQSLCGSARTVGSQAYTRPPSYVEPA
ncbi:hypothetical protein SISSUDRAFT_1068247 [Sistotremastrum suecicum HHB10207 ss-3]|uniref:Acetyl-coenzyme A carboxylase carboxyl transferase subunit beta domain-containing protein n=1 Tax=Sistotremastrum suecicum HHB10207 ss-3 TaxID=1314776 RepID=A0A165WD73_9AGAM|nr:hypothetical protein SISSUDRAFT_1068247 [Sistotremastrum suecicum HHB10207 ss-3]